jgi:RNA polymerase sigma factor (sigma-70 family)
MENVFVDQASVRLRRPARLLRLASDERLVALVRAGEEGAFEALYDRHQPAMLGFCRHMLGTREEAEDAVQHAFLAAFRDLVDSPKPIDLRPWLFAIARNRCLSLLRARRAHFAIELAEPATDGLADTVERREDLRELLADLACLPEDQRAALLLAELGALDHAGIATVLGCPREKVKALVFQARTSLAANREARATPCEDVRVELATASGAALRRGPLRRHLRICDGCRAFKTEVATQRKLLALALPVVPSLALKASVLGGSGASSAAGGGTAAAVTAAAAGTTSGGGLGGGVFGTMASAGAGKVAVSLAVAGAVASGGMFTVQLEQRNATHVAPTPSRAGTPHGALTPPAAFGAPAHRGAPHVLSASGPRPAPPRRTHHPAVPRPAGSSAPGVVPLHARIPTPAHVSPGDAQPPVQPRRTPEADPAAGTGGLGQHGSAAPPPNGHVPPQQAHGQQPSSTPRGQGKTPPGQSKAPPGQSKAPPGQGNAPPGQSNAPPGQSNAPPGQSKAPPGQSNAPPGQSKAPPGQGNAPPGQSRTPPGQSKAPPGQSRTPASQSTTPPGQSNAPPGQSGASHGHAG